MFLNNSQNSEENTYVGVTFFKNTFFYRTSPVAAPGSFRFAACNFIIKETTAKMFVCEFCKIFKDNLFFDRTPQDDCFLCLSVDFEFFRTLLLLSASGKLLLRVQVEEFQPPDTVKNYFTGPFKRFIQEREVAIRRRLFT